MTDKDKQLKEQRDRFLAFSFASADLFLEVDEDGEITFTLGAAVGLTGIDHTKLQGHKWLEIFDKKDRAILTSMRQKARTGERCGPLQVRMDKDLCQGKEAIFTAIKMPGTERFYMAIGFVSELMLRLANIVKEQEEISLLDKDTFLMAAKDALDLARSIGDDIDMTLLDIADPNAIRSKLGEEIWEQFLESLTTMLSENSVDGHSIAEISAGRYSILHDKEIKSDTLRSQVEELTKEQDPDGVGFDIESKTVSADLQTLNERETTKALIYTINEFERKGTSLNIDNLNNSFKAYVSANAQKMQQFKTAIEQLRFDIIFHPIVSLENYELQHYEMLSKFTEEGSTHEWIIFGEDIGMAADFDIAVCERAINHLLYNASNTRTKFSVNLSGQSIQNEQFFKTLYAKLTMNKDLAERMIFEITESTTIEKLDMVNKFIKQLQEVGFRVCLDDFGTGAASLQYLQQLEVDMVKIDGLYTRKFLTSERDYVMIKNLVQMCKDLEIDVIAEKIETEEEENQMKSLGVQYGQGYRYAKPSKKPDYLSEKAPANQ